MSTPNIFNLLMQQLQGGGVQQAPTQPQAQNQPPNLFDLMSQNLSHTDAVSRITKAPIHIANVDRVTQDLERALSGKSTTPDSPTKAEGHYDPNEGTLHIYLNGKPSWQDLKGVIAHEDIHRALSPPGAPITPPPSGAERLINHLTGLFHDPQTLAEQGFMQGNRAGSMAHELPAYISAFTPGQLKGFSPEDRNRWLKAFLPKLPTATRKVVLRIIAAHDAPNPTAFTLH